LLAKDARRDAPANGAPTRYVYTEDKENRYRRKQGNHNEETMWLRILITTLAILLILPVRPVLAHANDRTLQGESLKAGPYRLTVWTAPSRLRTGEIHVETIVFDQAGNVDKKCAVFVALKPLDPELAEYSVLSTPIAGASEGIREARFKVNDPGLYRVEATVVDGTGTGGEVTFQVEVIRVSFLVRFFIYLLLGASALASLWIVAKGLEVWFGDLRLSKRAI
jgi:hypothetical protein